MLILALKKYVISFYKTRRSTLLSHPVSKGFLAKDIRLWVHLIWSVSHQVRHSIHPSAVERDHLERRLRRRVANDEQDVRPTGVENFEETAVVGEQH
jgi:hypothetical protein